MNTYKLTLKNKQVIKVKADDYYIGGRYGDKERFVFIKKNWFNRKDVFNIWASLVKYFELIKGV